MISWDKVALIGVIVVILIGIIIYLVVGFKSNPTSNTIISSDLSVPKVDVVVEPDLPDPI